MRQWPQNLPEKRVCRTCVAVTCGWQWARTVPSQRWRWVPDWAQARGQRREERGGQPPRGRDWDWTVRGYPRALQLGCDVGLGESPVVRKGRILGLNPPWAWLWGDPQPQPELLGFLIPPAGSCAGLPHRNEADHALPVNRPSDGDVPACAGARAPSAAGLSLCLVGILHFSGTGPVVVNAANPSPQCAFPCL